MCKLFCVFWSKRITLYFARERIVCWMEIVCPLYSFDREFVIAVSLALIRSFLPEYMTSHYCECFLLLTSGYLSLLPLEERNTICWWSGHLQPVDMVGANRQWQATHSQQKVFDCCTCCAVSNLLSVHGPFVQIVY